MSYSTVEDFEAFFGELEAKELTNLDNPLAEAIDTGVLQGALDYATALIDSYLAGNYTLPLVSVPQILKYDCSEIARFYLDKYKTRDDVTERYQLVIQRLRDISKGTVNLGLDQNNIEVGPDAGEPAYVSALPVFTMESLSGF